MTTSNINNEGLYTLQYCIIIIYSYWNVHVAKKRTTLGIPTSSPTVVTYVSLSTKTGTSYVEINFNELYAFYIRTRRQRINYYYTYLLFTLKSNFK